MEALDLLAYPFAVSALLVIIHAYFGIHVLERGIIFVDLALAQFIGLGIAVSFLPVLPVLPVLAGYDGAGRYALSLLFGLLGASILSLSRAIKKIVNIEAFIGVLYIFSLAGSILVLDRTPHGMEEFKAILNGNILWVNGQDALYAALLYAAVGIFHLIFHRRFFALSSEGSGALIWELLFFFSFAVVLISSVSLAGILQVFSFLVIPVLTGKLFARSTLSLFLLSCGIGIITSFAGIVLSHVFDLPTAPLIVFSLSVAFLAALTVKTVILK